MSKTKILKLEIKNFKSFHKKTVIPFKDNFNVILGPNGSGKSNILDAMCFVLGKTSSKALRAENNAKLIFNGGNSKKPAKSASVSIYLDNKTGVFSINDDVVKFTRIVDKDGKGTYKVNDKTVTKREMTELLSQAGIDSDGYNIVLQGDVSRFVEMTANNRRELIEEISGLGVYEKKKDKALKELEKVDDKLNEAKLVLGEKSNYLNELEEDYDNAKKYLELKEEVKNLKATLIKLNIEEISEDKEKYDKKIKSFKDKIKEIENKVSELEEEKNNVIKEIESISSKIEKDSTGSENSYVKKIEKLSEELSSKKGDLNILNSEIERNKNRQVEIDDNIEDLESKVERANKDIEALGKRKESLKTELDEVNELISNLKKKNSLDSLDEIEGDIEEIEKEIEEKNDEVHSLREKQQNLLRKKDRLEMELDSLESQLRKVSKLEDEEKKKLDLIKEKKKRYKEVTVKLNKILSENSSVSAELNNARTKKEELSRKLSKIKGKTMMIKEKLSHNNAIKVILDMKGSIDGIYGTVGELGRVSSEYSLALEVAAGGRMYSIVVKDDSTASKCISVLRNKKVGTANFLPINKIHARTSDVGSVLNKDGVVGLARNLISYDPKFKVIFDYVFSNTIVVDDLTTARSLMKRGRRIVTLDGDLIKGSGAMQGGYRKKKKSAGFVNEDLDNKLEDVEREIQNYERLISKLEEKKTRTEEHISNLRKEKASLEGEIIKEEKSLSLNQDELDVSKDKKEVLQEKIDDIDDELDEIRSKLRTRMKDLTKLKTQKQEKRDEISSARDPSLIAELNSYEDKKESIKEQLSKVNVKLSTQESRKENVFLKELNKIKEIRDNLNDEFEEFKENKESLIKEIKDFDNQLKEIKEKNKEFQSKFKELFEDKKKLEKKSDNISTKMNDLLEDRRNHEKKINDISLKSAQINAKYDSLQDQLNDIEDYEIYDLAKSTVKKKLASKEVEMDSFGNVNMKALEMYDQVKKEYERLVSKREELISEKDQVIEMMNKIETKKKQKFMDTYETLKEKFYEKFNSLSYKPAQAMLKLTNPDDPLDGGVEVKVKSEGKRYLDIRSLSGGEKTMTAIAFLFAVQEFSPAPFYILDEVDAALDKKNSEQLSVLIKDFSENAQYVVISHNDNVITQSNAAFGLSMNKEGISKVVSLDLE
ncbi:MAG: chromosome segregation protein SMC [Candidatus Woesearchaeota archaeon]